MPFDALGNFIPDDELPSLDAMQYELAQKKPSTLDIVKAGIQNMPGASFAQGVAPLVNFPFQVAGSALYGLGKQLISPEADFNKDTTEAMRALQYEPPTQAGKEFQESISTALEASKLPPYIGHMPPMRFNANDARVIAKQNIERAREVGRIPEDFRNAQEGLRRESNLGGETYGSTLGSLENATIGEYQRNKIRKASENAPSDTAYDPLRKRREEASVEVYSVPEGATPYYAVRNTGEGQMMRPVPTEAGVRPSNVTYGETEELLSSMAPELDINKPESIIDSYETHYMEGNTYEQRALQDKWEKFYKDKAKELFPHDFSADDALRALRKGYPPREVRDMRLKWFHDFVNKANAEGFPIPTMEEYLTRAQAANLITKKIIPNIVQKYMGTPNDPFIESAKKGVTFTPAEELLKYETPSQQLMHMRTEGGFQPQGEIADKLMPVAESKLATQSQELDNLIAEQNQVGQTEGMMVPYPDGRIDPETGSVMLATNPNYAKYTNKIGAMRKAIEDTEEEIRNLKLAQSYENVSDAAVRTKNAQEVRYNIPREEEQFYPNLFAQKPRETSISPTIYKTPDEAKFFEVAPSGFGMSGMQGLTKQLVADIMQGKIPPEQVPTMSQPHTITKYMSDIVAPRLEKEKAARLAQKTYKADAENHFVEVLNAIPDSMKVGTNAKVLWIDEGMPQDEIIQNLSDETFVLDHCIGQSGNGRGLKNLFTGDERAYIPMVDPVTGQKFKGAGSTSSYMDAVESGEKEIMSLRDSTTGMPVGTIELSVTQNYDTGDRALDIGYVSGYKNHSNKFGGIDSKYREALRDALNLVKDEVVSTSGNETRSGVFDMRDRDQLNTLREKLKLPDRTRDEKAKAWAGVQKNIMDNLDGDRYITLEQAEEAFKQYKADNPPVPVVRTGFPPAGKDVTERNIVMQGLSRENLDTTRQFNAARIVADGTRFGVLPLAPSQMEPRPLAAYRGILNSLSNRAGNTGMSDYEVFRNLQDYVDQIDNGDLRFADFNLGGHSELTDLKDGLQKHADAMGQLAHYADVLQRNGYRSPLPSEQTGAPEWQAYQRFIGELGIDNPQDLSTRLRDMISHGDPREIDPNLDELQRENFRHLLEIHDRSLKQAVNFPAPTAPTQLRGIPLQQWEQLTQSGMNEIQRMYGNQTRDTVANIMVDAIGSQMDTPVNERPVQVSNFLNTQANDTTWPVEVRTALRNLAGHIDQANADIQNARNAPQTPALPSVNDLRDAINRGVRTIPSMGATQDALQAYDEISEAMTRNGQLAHQNPVTLANQLTERGNYLIGEGEPDVGNGLLAIAREVSQLAPANPPASMALSNQPRMIAAGADNAPAGDRVEARLQQIGEVDQGLSNSLRRMLDTYEYDRIRNQTPEEMPELLRNLRREANEAMEGGEGEYGTALINISNEIAEANHLTTFTPAPAIAEPRRTPRDIALSVNGLVGGDIDEMANLIQIELRDLPTDRVALRQADLFYQDANNLPDEITNLTHDYQDAERIANYIRQHIESRLGNLPQRENQLTTAGMPTPRDVAQRVAPDSTHQNLDQRRRQVQTIAEGINNEIRSLPNDMAGLERALEFYQDYDNLPTEMMARIPSEEDANIVLRHIRQHIQNRIANLPENRGQDLQASYERVSDEIRGTYTNNYLEQFQNGDMDVRNTVLQDVADRPSVYGMARLSAQQQRDMVERLRTEGLHDPWVAEEPQRLPEDEGHTFNTMGRIQEAIGRRGASVNREHLGISQQFDTIVEAASREFNPQRQPERFVTSLLQRASSVENNNRTEVHPVRRELARQLRLLADDVQALIETAQAQGLPAPEQQQAGTGALSATEQVIARARSVDLLNGDRNAMRELEPADRHMVQVLTRYGHPHATSINELDHRRLINTLTSQTYNPATDGEALLTLAETRAGMFAGLNDEQATQVEQIVNDWNRLRFPNYRPPEAGMGEDPVGHKRGGYIRKMNDGGQPPALTPYEQFKIDNAERIRQGQEINENRNKYEPNKGSDRPIPTQRSAPRGGGGSSFGPMGSQPWSPMDRPHLYSIGGKVYMEVGGGVKPVPNVPYTPEKTNPNTTDHVIKRPVDEGFREIYERVRNTPKPTGSAGTMPSGNGASYLDRPHLYARGGRVHMYEGGGLDSMQAGEGSYGSMGHMAIDPRQDTKTPAEYARSGLPEVTGDPYDVWETKYNLNQATRENLNFNDPAYSLGIKEVRASTPMDASWGGFHSSDEPDVVHIKNIHGEPQFYSQTLTHEGQHLQDYKTDQNKFKPKGHIDALEYLYKTGNQYLNQRAIENNYQAYKDKWVAEHPDEMPYNKLGAYWNADAPFNERIADLNSIEGELKRGERFADTPMGKEILNTPELQSYYYQSVRPMEPKAVAYEPTVFDRIRNAGRNFQEKVGSGKSYANSAYESAKEFKDGGDVNIDAMRLALTKG